MRRYGVIGTGMMGREHIANLNAIDETTVVAIADMDDASLALGQELTGLHDSMCFNSYLDLLSQDLDAIVIATPNHTHVDVALDAMQTQSHILIEKPLAISVAECDKIVAAAEEREPITWMGLEYRYKPPIAAAIEEARSGAAGRIKMVAIREHRFPFLVKVNDWNRFRKKTGGTLVEKCCHFFDLMNVIIEAKPVRVYASGAQDVNHLDEIYDGEIPDIIDNAYVIVDYENGARALLDLCMFAEASRNEQEIAITGDTGKIEAFVPEAVLRVGDRKTWRVTESTVVDESIAYVGAHEGSSYLEHLDFLEAIESGSPPKVTVADGRLAVAMGLAGQLSIDERRPVEMSELL